MSIYSHLPFQVYRKMSPGNFERVGTTPGMVEVPEQAGEWFVFTEEPLDETLVAELERLEIRGLALRGEDQLGWLERFPDLALLKVLDRPDSRLSDAGLRRVAGLVELQSLIVYGYGAHGDPGVRELAVCTELRNLHLQTAGTLTGHGLATLQEYLELRALTLGHARELDDLGLRRAELSVRWLRLEGCPRIDGTGLASVSGLRTLEIYGCGLTDVGLVHLCSGIPELEQLRLEWCDNLTDDALTRLTRLSRLHSLEVTGCPLGDRALAALASHPSLRRLVLADCDKVTDTGLTALAGLPLTAIGLDGCRNISAAGVRLLIDGSQPEEVAIRRCPQVDMRLLGASEP